MQHQVTEGVLNAKYTTAAQTSVMGDQNGGPWGFHLSKHTHTCMCTHTHTHTQGSYMHNEYTIEYYKELQYRVKHNRWKDM